MHDTFHRRPVVKGGDNRNRHRRIALAQDIQPGKAVDTRQGQIEQHQIELTFVVEHGQRRLEIGTLADFDARFDLPQQPHQTFANQCVIFNNQQLQHKHPSSDRSLI